MLIALLVPVQALFAHVVNATLMTGSRPAKLAVLMVLPAVKELTPVIITSSNAPAALEPVGKWMNVRYGYWCWSDAGCV